MVDKTQFNGQKIKKDGNSGKPVYINININGKDFEGEGEYLGTINYLLDKMPTMYFPLKDMICIGAMCWWNFIVKHPPAPENFYI